MALGLTQVEAASRAGISFATWRRWEEDPTHVRASTRTSCERMLEKAEAAPAARTAMEQEFAAHSAKFVEAWGECPYLTPRQAMSIAITLDVWKDAFIDEWLKDPTSEPLHELGPFRNLQLQVMMHVNESRAWAALAAERCAAVAAEIENGILPFERPGCYFDELLMGLALPDAQEQLKDQPDMFADVAARTADEAEAEAEFTLDDEWDAVSDAFDDMAYWMDWEVPVYSKHPLLPALLAERHPYTWFDSPAQAMA